MKLSHKIYKLIDPENKPAKFKEISDLRILIEGWDFDIPVLTKKEGGIAFLNDAAKWKDDSFEAFSIFEKFDIDGSGYLVHDGIHISFMDASGSMELRVKEIVDPPLLMVKFPGTLSIDDESHNVLTVALKQFYLKAIESAESEVTIEPETEPATLTETPSTEPAATTEPAAITEPAATTEPVPTTEPAATTEPTIIPVPVTTDENESGSQENSSKEEEEVIPEEVMNKFEGYRNDLVNDGYEEYQYKNFRVFYKEVSQGELDDHGKEKLPHSNVYVLLLTNTEVMEIEKLVICEDESNEEKVKYQFKLNGEKKSAYIDRKAKTLVIKKPKKKEEEKA